MSVTLMETVTFGGGGGGTVVEVVVADCVTVDVTNDVVVNTPPNVENRSTVESGVL